MEWFQAAPQTPDRSKVSGTELPGDMIGELSSMANEERANLAINR